MALLRVKRPLDLDGLNDALPSTCSGAAHFHHVDSAAELAQASKRQRFNEMMAAAASQAGVPIGAGVRESPFVSPKPVETKEIEKIISTSLDSPKRAGDGDSSPKAQRQGEKRLYTFEEVTAILNKALHDREHMIRQEYNQVLSTKLAEQFQSFTKFNQDYISRQIKGNPFSYVS